MKQTTKKEKFFKESLKLIHEKGFKAVTMRDIAQRLDFEPANIYNYIDSKQALLELYLFDISYEFHDSLNNILRSSYSPEDKLKLIISTHILLTARKPYKMALLVNEWRNLKEPKLTEFIEGKKVYENKIRDVIAKGIEEGQFRPMDIEIATYSFLSSLRWIYDKYTDGESKINPFELEKQISDFVFTGMSK